MSTILPHETAHRVRDELTSGREELRSGPDTPRLRFDRYELAGAFGDIGTDLPLLIALVLTVGLDAASVCILFGALQIITGLLYGIPMPVQPLKAMAAVMLTQRLAPGALIAGGIVIGAAMLLLAATGVLNWLARHVPKAVVRGIQLALGFTLAKLALFEYATRDGWAGYILALLAALALVMLKRQTRIPGPLVVIGLGMVYAIVTKFEGGSPWQWVGLRLPSFHWPSHQEWIQGVLLLALPQLPLSLGNSVIATSQTTHDLFPKRAVSVRRIGFTYGIMNLVAPWFGGIPVCHGCGGLVGFYGFGARTGGAPVLYGAMYLLLGLIFSPGFGHVVQIFPMPILGVILFFEALGLMWFARDVVADRQALVITVLVAIVAVTVPFGYVVGLVFGMILPFLMRSRRGVPAH